MALNPLYPSISNEYTFIRNNIFPYCENDIIEFKDKRDLTESELAKIFSGFANHDGGYLYLGIADDRQIKGIEMNSKKLDEFKLHIDKVSHECIYPSIHKIKINLFGIQIIFINLNSE